VRAEDIKEISLVLPGPKQERVPAQFLGARPEFGLAFLRAKEKRNWRAVRFASSSDLKTGQLVVSAGLMPGSSANVPYVGMGYVSARLKVPDTLYYVTGGKLTCLGSPVFSSSGLAVGLVSRTVYMDYQTPTPRGPTMVSLKGMQEASFFIPVEEFVDALKQVPHDGTVARPAWMGVLKALGASKEQADLMKLTKPAVMIDQVIPASPAAQAGLKSGDILVALDGRPIELLSTPELTGENFLRTIMLTPVGKKVTVTVSRQGAEKQVELTLTEMPILAEEAPRYVNDSLGLAVREKVDLDLYLDQSGAKQVSGLSVIGVADQGPAQAAGLKTGDVITAVNGTNVRSADLFRKQIEQSVKDDPQKGIVFMVHRGDAEPRPVTVAPAVRDAAREDRPQP